MSKRNDDSVSVAVEKQYKYLDGEPVELKWKSNACIGAGEFNCMAISCAAVGLVLPIVALIVAGGTDDSDDAFALEMIALSGFLVGLIVVCVSISPAVCGGALCGPTPPPAHKPLKYARSGQRRGHRVALRKVMVVVNPGSGVKGTSNDSLNLYDRFMNRARTRGVECVKRETQPRGPSHACCLVRDFDHNEGFDAVVVIGGDGTLFQAVNGMLQRDVAHRVPIGVIPGGTGNSFLTDTGLRGHNEADETRAMDFVLSGQCAYIDTNLVTVDDHRRYFSVNELTWGLTGDVGMDAELVSYDVCGLWGVFVNPVRPCKVTIKDTNQTFEGNMTTALVTNTQHFGKEMRVSPAAVLDDGWFDFNFIWQSRRGILLKVFALLPSGAHSNNIEGSVEMQAKHCIIEPKQPGVVNIDGENFPYNNKLEIECQHKVLQVLLPYEELCQDQHPPAPSRTKPNVAGAGEEETKLEPHPEVDEDAATSANPHAARTPPAAATDTDASPEAPAGATTDDAAAPAAADAAADAAAAADADADADANKGEASPATTDVAPPNPPPAGASSGVAPPPPPLAVASDST